MTTAGAQQNHVNDGGSSDGFVARLRADLQTLLQATYLGGSIDDRIHAMAVHPATGDNFIA